LREAVIDLDMARLAELAQQAGGTKPASFCESTAGLERCGLAAAGVQRGHAPGKLVHWICWDLPDKGRSPMKRKRFTDEQIISILKEAEREDKTVAQVTTCRAAGGALP
jgi:hypothetical protein